MSGASVRRVAQVGRACRWCLNTDHDSPFENEQECEACAAARRRPNGRCPVCSGPKKQIPYYCPCSPPNYLKPIVVLEEGSDRERTIHRTVTSQGWLSVACKYQKYPTDGGPLVVTLPRARWIQCRR